MKNPGHRKSPNTKSGSGENLPSGEDELLARLQKSLQLPHVSSGGNAMCVNPNCRARMIKSNATLEINSIVHKAVMISGKTKVFMIGKSIVGECICGTRYDLGNALEKGFIQ
jgi:hypothetical protein